MNPPFLQTHSRKSTLVRVIDNYVTGTKFSSSHQGFLAGIIKIAEPKRYRDQRIDDGERL